MRLYYTISILFSLLLHLALLMDFSSLQKEIVSVEIGSAKTSFRVNLNKLKQKNVLHKKNPSKILNKKNKNFSNKKSSKAKSSISVRNKFIPKYPYKSRLFDEEGRVIVKVVIDEDANVLNSTIVESSGYERLDLAALDASRKSSFIISKKGHDNIITHTLEFNFKLDR